MRATLLTRVRDTLARAGYCLNAEDAMRPLSFDVVARRDGELVLIKVLTNVDGLSEPVAVELRTIARFLEATPIVVGERSSSRELETGAVYVRHGVRIVNGETLAEYMLEGIEPLVYAAPGGFYVTLDGARLRSLREQRGLSLGDLAQAAGVSRRAVGMYEEGMAAMVEVAARLEEYLQEPLAQPCNPFQVQPDQTLSIPPPHDFAATFEGAVLRAMHEMGFRVATTAKSPFAAVTREDEVVVTGIGADTPDLARRAAATSNLCDVTETFGVFFVERTTTRVAIEGMPVVSREELARIAEPERLIELLRERRGQRR